MPRYPASHYPLEIAQGVDFEKVLVYYPDGVDAAPRDWSGYTGKAQMRSTPRAEDALLEFDVLLGSDGSVRLSADHTDTANLEPGHAVWDLYITDPEGDVDRFLAGSVTISQQVTR